MKQTDDVGVFRSPVSNEYLLAARHFNLGQLDLVDLSEAAVESMFSGEADKQRMRQLISKFRAEL